MFGHSELTSAARCGRSRPLVWRVHLGGLARRHTGVRIAVYGVLAALAVARVGRRLWAAIACAHVAILLWYVTAHQERYLLPLVPLMAAVVAATLALAWQQGSGWCVACSPCS